MASSLALANAPEDLVQRRAERAGCREWSGGGWDTAEGEGGEWLAEAGRGEGRRRRGGERAPGRGGEEVAED